MQSTLFNPFQFILICALVFPLSANAMEVTPLSNSGAQLIDSGSTPQIGGTTFTSTEIENPHPNWIFQGLIPTETWEKYGKRPSAFAKTGTQPFDPASMAMLSAPTSTKSLAKRGVSSTTRKAAPSTVTMPKGHSPYSGAAPSTGTPSARRTATGVSGANNSTATNVGAGSANTNNETVPNTTTIAPSSGVTHTRAPSGPQINNELSLNPTPYNIPKSESAASARPHTGATVTGAIEPAPAPVVAQSAPAAPSPTPAPNRPGNIAPKIMLPPNNGTGALVSPTQNL